MQDMQSSNSSETMERQVDSEARETPGERTLEYQTIPVTPFQQNCTLLYDQKTKEGVLVDPGGDLHLIEEALKSLKVTLKQIWITHAHVDHAGATAQAARTWSIPIEGPHREDLFWIESLPQQAQMFGGGEAEVFQPDRWLTDGDTVGFSDHTFQVIHCPGHTPGHVVFFNRKHNLALVGDVLFSGSIGRTDFLRGDHATLIASIRKKLFPLGDDITFICGHGPNSTFGKERQTNPFVSDKVAKG